MKNLILVVITLVIVWGCNNPVAEEPTPVLDHKVLKLHNPNPTVINLELLVAPESDKDSVLALAEYYLKFYEKKYAFGYIFIFDNRETASNRMNENYPDSQLYRHWLVNAAWNQNTKHRAVNWVKED